MSLAVGFVGARLSEARRARRMTATDLSDLTNVSVQSISKYENGHSSPRQDTVTQFADTLRMPRLYFFRKVAAEDSKPVFWRSKLSAQATDLDRALVRLEWMKEMLGYLASYFDFPALDLPKLDVPENPLDLTEDDIEAFAQQVRAYWGVERGALTNVLEKIEESGILVSRIHVRAEKVDAFSQWSDVFEVPFIVLSRDKASAVRQRFDALHELFHVLAHRQVTQTTMNDRAKYKKLEKQADIFARYMLLPEQEFADELYAPTLDAMLSLKESWGASVAAMIMRCKSMGVLSETALRRLWMNYTRRGWRKCEPFDGRMEKEQPYLIRRSFEMLLENDVQSVADIRKALPFPLEDIEEIADMDEGTLGATKCVRLEPVLKVKDNDNVVRLFNKND